MKKYNINNEIPLPPSPTETGNTDSNLDKMLNCIDLQHDYDEEEKRLMGKLETVERLISAIEQSIITANSMCKKMENQSSSFRIAYQSIDNVINHINGICSKLGSMVIPAKLEPNSEREFSQFIRNLIQEEKKLLLQHREQQSQEWTTLNDDLQSIFRKNKGAWFSNKVFWWSVGILVLSTSLSILLGGMKIIELFN